MGRKVRKTIICERKREKINLNHDNGNRMEREMTEERLPKHLLPIGWGRVCASVWVSRRREWLGRGKHFYIQA